MSKGTLLADVARFHATVLEVHDAGRARLNMLRLEHLVLEVLAVAHVVLLDREAQPVVVVVTHRHLVWHAAVVMLVTTPARHNESLRCI